MRFRMFACSSLVVLISCLGCHPQERALPIVEIEQWAFGTGAVPAESPDQLMQLTEWLSADDRDVRQELAVAGYLAFRRHEPEKQYSRLRRIYLRYWQWATGASGDENLVFAVEYLPGVLEEVFTETGDPDAFSLLVELQLDGSPSTVQLLSVLELLKLQPAKTLSIMPLPERMIRNWAAYLKPEERAEIVALLRGSSWQGLAEHNSKRILMALEPAVAEN